MKRSQIHIKIGNRQFNGLFGILIALPILVLVGLILFGVFSFLGIALSIILSVVGVIIALALGICFIAIIIALITSILPKKWRDKLGIHVHKNSFKVKKSKPTQTPDGKPIVDVDFKEEK